MKTFDEYWVCLAASQISNYSAHNMLVVKKLSHDCLLVFFWKTLDERT